MLIALPQGLNISGVAMWAARLANGLAVRGRAVGLVLHECAGAAGVQVPLSIDPRVRVARVEEQTSGAAPLASCGGDLSKYIPVYRELVRALSREQGGGPVVVSPNLHGDCYGIAAALALAEPELVRIVGWQHSDIEYDARLLAHYEPMIAKFVGVSDAIEGTLRGQLAMRTGDVVNIAYGVECTAEGMNRPRGRAASSGRRLKLIYTGRVEHEQKRILALSHLSDELALCGIDHEITIVGDGPAAAELDAAVLSRGSIRRIGGLGPDGVASLLDDHDLFVLPSRYEGLSVSMLEAMARGCVPVLARTRSGAAQAIEPGYNGELAEVAPDADEQAAGKSLAEAIAGHLARGQTRRQAMSRAAAQTIREKFSLDLHIGRVEKLLDEVATSPARPWPAQRPCAFTAAPGEAGPHGSGSVPPGGAAQLGMLLRQLAGRKIIIHGTGQHTLQLGAVLAQSPAEIVAFTDDDRQRYGERLWNWPIIGPDQAAGAGATDVVISSWMHQDAIWARRSTYESRGLQVHRIYDRAETDHAPEGRRPAEDPVLNNPRYEGKPFLRVLELYIMWCADQLPPGEVGRVDELTPYLQNAFNRTGPWHQIVAKEMQFPDDLPQRVRDRWKEFVEHAEKAGQTPSPELFAQAFVDQNFPML